MWAALSTACYQCDGLGPRMHRAHPLLGFCLLYSSLPLSLTRTLSLSLSPSPSLLLSVCLSPSLYLVQLTLHGRRTLQFA